MTFRYLLQRLATLLLVLVGVSILTFGIIPLVPGSPARVTLGVQATDASVAALEHKMGLDRPLPVQYWSWLSGIVLHGDFGNSLINGKPIAEQVRHRLPATLVLAFAALFLGLVIAVPSGIVSALRPGSARDLGVSVMSQIGVSIPDFWLGILLILVFAQYLHWLPSSGYSPISNGLGAYLDHILLPAVTAGVISGSIMARFVRSAMMEVLGNDYVRTARAKGLAEGRVVGKHVLRNAAITIVTIVGLQMATLLSSIVVVEIIFAWPGLGSMALTATLQRDYPVLQASVLLFATSFAVINLLTDLSYVLLDPSVEYA